MADWSFVVGDKLLGPEFGLEAQSPTLNFFLSGQPHEFSCSIDARTEAGRNLLELAQDVWAWRDGQLPFRGPLISCPDTFDLDSHTVALTARSYRERLAHWPIPLTGSVNGMTPLGASASMSGLGWRAINLTLPSSDLASIIVDSHIAVGPLSTKSVQGSTATDAAIDTLAQIGPFDWDLTPTADGLVHYESWTPTRGIAKPEVVLIYDEDGEGSNCTGSRTPDIGAFGTQVWLTGQDAAGNSVVKKSTAPYGPEGLWIITADSSTVDASQLQDEADNQLVTAQTLQPSYTLKPSAGDWWGGPDHVWLGDAVHVVIKSGRLDVDAMMRVQQISLSPADGNDNIEISVGGKPIGKGGQTALLRAFRNINDRIHNREWRQ